MVEGKLYLIDLCRLSNDQKMKAFIFVNLFIQLFIDSGKYRILTINTITIINLLFLFQEMKNQRKIKKEPKITQKKLEGDKVYYLVVKNRTKKWVDFDSIDDYLELVMEYEKEQEDIKSYLQEQDNCDNTREQEKQQHQCGTRSRMKKKKIEEKNDENRNINLMNILFLNKNEGQLFFKLIYENGTEEIIGNKELRHKYPQELISFYQNNIQITERQTASN